MGKGDDSLYINHDLPLLVASAQCLQLVWEFLIRKGFYYVNFFNKRL